MLGNRVTYVQCVADTATHIVAWQLHADKYRDCKISAQTMEVSILNLQFNRLNSKLKITKSENQHTKVAIQQSLVTSLVHVIMIAPRACMIV